MRTLGNPLDRDNLVRRLGTVRADSAARWGRMSAHQMVCHARDALRMANGELAVSADTGPLQRTIIKWTALYLPVPWPAGIQTRPELDQQACAARATDFAGDVAQLESLLIRFASEPRTARPAHPIFGRMSQKAWLRWGYVHTDHHLRQFGA